MMTSPHTDPHGDPADRTREQLQYEADAAMMGIDPPHPVAPRGYQPGDLVRYEQHRSLTSGEATPRSTPIGPHEARYLATRGLERAESAMICFALSGLAFITSCCPPLAILVMIISLSVAALAWQRTSDQAVPRRAGRNLVLASFVLDGLTLIVSVIAAVFWIAN